MRNIARSLQHNDHDSVVGVSRLCAEIDQFRDGALPARYHLVHAIRYSVLRWVVLPWSTWPITRLSRFAFDVKDPSKT